MVAFRSRVIKAMKALEDEFASFSTKVEGIKDSLELAEKKGNYLQMVVAIRQLKIVVEKKRQNQSQDDENGIVLK